MGFVFSHKFFFLEFKYFNSIKSVKLVLLSFYPILTQKGCTITTICKFKWLLIVVSLISSKRCPWVTKNLSIILDFPNTRKVRCKDYVEIMCFKNFVYIWFNAVLCVSSLKKTKSSAAMPKILWYRVILLVILNILIEEPPATYV